MKKGRLRRKSRKIPASFAVHGARIALAAMSVFLVALLTLSAFHWGSAQTPAPLEVPEGDAAEETERAPAQNGGIEVELTDFDEGVSESIRLELLKISTPDKINLSGVEPRVLIYHTHTTEAYNPIGKYTYVSAGEWRTRENDKNVVALGERLAKLLNETYGIATLHDITDHEPPKLDTSYERSLATMLKYKKQYPSITLFIDLHRDEGAGRFVTIDGKEVAQMMFVVGTGKGATGTGYGEMPDFAANHALAKKLTERLREVDPNLMRDIRVKNGRYNQHVSNQCLLLEVGNNKNTFEQAFNAIDYFAQALADVAGVEYERDIAVQTIYQFSP